MSTQKRKGKNWSKIKLEQEDAGTFEPTQKQLEYLHSLKMKLEELGESVIETPNITTRREYSFEIQRLKKQLETIQRTQGNHWRC